MGLYHLIPTTGQGSNAAHDLQAHELGRQNVRREAKDGAKSIQGIMPGLDGGQDSIGFRR